MDLRQLEAFAAVMASGSITGSARVLGRSQPALTRLIQELEAEIGFELLHRRGPRITPTAKGIAFHREVEPMLAWMRQLNERAAEIAAEKPVSLTIASIASFAAGMVPAALARLDPAALPDQIHVRTALAEQVVQSVTNLTAEIGVTSLPVDHPAIDIQWIGEAPCVAVIAEDDPLAALPVVPLAALAGRRLLTMANPFRWRRRVDVALARAAVTPAAVLDANTSATALMAARAGLGVAILEPVIAYGMPMSGVAIRPLDTRIAFFWCLLSAQGRPVSAAGKRLIDEIETMARETLPGFVRHEAAAADSLIADLFGPSPSHLRQVADA
jgi:DNA-binding transcriptional LysR family regulator